MTKVVGALKYNDAAALPICHIRLHSCSHIRDRETLGPHGYEKWRNHICPHPPTLRAGSPASRRTPLRPLRKMHTTCWEVGFVGRPHLLVGGVRSVPTNLVEVKGKQELREIEDEKGEEEVGWNGELKVEE